MVFALFLLGLLTVLFFQVHNVIVYSSGLLRSPEYQASDFNIVDVHDLGAGPNGYHNYLLSGTNQGRTFALLSDSPELPERFNLVSGLGADMASTRLGLRRVDFTGKVVELRWVYLLVDYLIILFIVLFGFFLFERRGMRRDGKP